MAKKVCVITGATSGIGKSAAIQLAMQGWIVVLISRNNESGKRAFQFIKEAYPKAKIDYFVADLSSQRAIHCACDTLCKKYPKIDALIHNAAIISPIKQITSDGLELTFAVNYLAPFLITSLLLPNLRVASEAKIIILTSRAEELGRINFENLQGEKKYNWIQSYSQSKLANLLFAYQLLEKEQKNHISVIAFHPGLTRSKLGRNLKGLFRFLPLILYPFMQSPEKSASFLIELLKLPYSSESRYFIKNKLARSSQLSYDKELGLKLWTISETLIQGII